MDDKLQDGFDKATEDKMKDVFDALRPYFLGRMAALRDQPVELIRGTLADSHRVGATLAAKARHPAMVDAVSAAASEIRDSLPPEERATHPELLASLRLQDRSELPLLAAEFAVYGIDVLLNRESIRAIMPDGSFLEWTLLIDDRGYVGAVTLGTGMSGMYHSAFGPLAHVLVDNSQVLFDVMAFLHHVAEQLKWHAIRT